MLGWEGEPGFYEWTLLVERGIGFWVLGTRLLAFHIEILRIITNLTKSVFDLVCKAYPCTQPRYIFSTSGMPSIAKQAAIAFAVA